MDAFFRRFFPDDDNCLKSYHHNVQMGLPERGAILDLGCGDLRELARYRTPARDVWGTDFEQHPRLSATDWFRPLEPNGRIPFATESFDLVAATWVLEHVETPVSFLREIARVLRPGGRLVVLTANGAHYVTLLTRLFRCLPHEVTQQIVYRLYGRLPRDTHPTHYRLNTIAQLRRAGQLAGLRLTELRHFANPDYFSFWRPLHRAAIITDWLLEQLSPGLGRLYLTATLEKPRLPANDSVERKAAA
jgi:SAM-dependent methyltransferase